MQSALEDTAGARHRGVALFRYELMCDQPQLWDDYEELWGSRSD